MDIVIQGKFYSGETPKIVENLLQTHFVDRIIISCWDSCPEFTKVSDEVTVVRSSPPQNSSDANRNLQIVSSLAGIRESSGSMCAKIRSDQIITVDSFNLMNEFYQEKSSEKFGAQKCALCVAGIYKGFPFHPRDHIYWGSRDDLLDIFEIPLCGYDNIPNPDYGTRTRTETYIGAAYASKFSEEAKKFNENPDIYLCDASPLRHEAMKLSDDLTSKLFIPFPRIDFNWPKHGLSNYDYHVQCQISEYWNEDERWKNRN